MRISAIRQLTKMVAQCYSKGVRISRSSGFLLIVASVALLLMAVSCSRDTAGIEAREEQDPLMVRAQDRKMARDIDGAIELYQEALAKKPDLAKAHLHLGLLFEEEREDHLRAIYHYETYLKSRPNTDKLNLVEELIRGAQLHYAVSLPDRPSEAIQEMAKMQKRLDAAGRDLEEAREEIVSLKGQVRAARQTALGGGEGARSGSSATSRAPAGTGAQYVVQNGDTLSRIARRVYSDSGKWKLIYDANRDTMDKPEDLRKGQVLRIPRG